MSIILIAVLLSVFYFSYKVFIQKNDIPNSIIFKVNNEETGAQIFNNLQKEGVIGDVFWAKVAAKLFNKNKFYRGEYLFDKPVSTFEAVFKITSRPVSLAVLIPEGFTKKQVADRLAKYIVRFDKKDFLEKAKEGYLFPDTYYFFAFSTNDEILQEFENKFNKSMLENFGRMPTKEEIIIASMLEREAKKPEEMKMISGIIQNRLKIDMPLQIDATVLYGQGVWKDRVLYSDLKTKNDYNTYQNTGLPVAPISNPGLNAIRAAMFPSKTKNMYYLTGKNGQMYYAVTHDEHVNNKLKYLR